MVKWNLILIAALIGRSMVLLKTSYQSSLVFTALDRARAEGQTLETERQRLEAERQAQGTNLRVERVARERLHMRSANAAVTQIVTAPASAASARVVEP